MSERMIELHRAKLGLPPPGVTPTMNSSQSTAGKSNSATNSSSTEKQLSPVEMAKATLLSEDAQIERFINRLQRRDRRVANTHTHHHHHHSDLMSSSHGPTVPTALSRRILQRQGVGFLDDTVASVVSASADRFLATVLQQSIACRDQRLKGAAMTREASKQRKRHMEEYEADNDDRKRRREAIHKAREDIAVLTIAAAETVKKGGSAGSSTADKKTTKTKSKKGTKKNPSAAASVSTGPEKPNKAMEALAMEESEEEYDSVDEEEEYYQENVVEVTRERIRLKKTGGSEDQEEDEEDEDSDDEDDTLLLRDIVRPLRAWNFHLNGKEAIATDDDDGTENNEGIEQSRNTAKADASVTISQQEQPADDKSKTGTESPNAGANGTDDIKQPNNEKKTGDAAPNGNKNGATKKPSTAPTAAAAASATNPTASSTS